MTDERDPSDRANPPRVGASENGAGHAGGAGDGMRDAPPRPGFSDQDPGQHRGPRRSRYGRRRMPNDGPGGEAPAGGFQQPRGADPAGEDVENYLPSFIAGPSNGPANGPANGPVNGGQDHQPGPSSHSQPVHSPSHQSGGHQGGHQGGQGHPQQNHQRGPDMNSGANPGMGYGGGHQPQHQQHADHQAGGHHQMSHQPSPQPPMPEEPSPETQAAAAAFAEWEASNPKLRGLLLCNPTVKRGEPIV